jgi:DNA processing protein
LNNLFNKLFKHTDFILTPEDIWLSHSTYSLYRSSTYYFWSRSAQALLQPQIAMVGSRKPSPHGRQVAYDFAYYLSEKVFISSGLAHGIDEAAHRGALAHHRTIAVTGTG